MVPHQWSPLQQYPATGEPAYLRLPAPHQNIIITPYRSADKDSIIEPPNDLRVYMTLDGPPHPYLPEHADSFLPDKLTATKALLGELANAENMMDELIPLGGFPVRAIREQREDGTELFLGDLVIDRSGFSYVLDEKERERRVNENNEKKVGDPTIVWEGGNYLRPSHHGRGITTAVLKTVVKEWVIPRNKARHIEVLIFAGNIANVRVYEKNGFVLRETVEDMCEIAESKGGGKVGIHVLEWKASDGS